jgi:nickel/cobalt transporter (NicO) family protein
MSDSGDLVACARGILLTVILLISGVLIIQPCNPALAQAPTAQTQPPSPQRSFLPAKPGTAMTTAQPAGPIDRLYIWVTHQQQAINQSLVAAVKNLKAGGGFSAALVLGGLSFMYGILHAAGPGHGKAVITAYVLADKQTLYRGILLSFLSALVQALMALLVVAVLKFVLDAAGIQTTKLTETWLERASWAFIALFGAWLLVRQIAAYRAGSAVAPRHRDHHHDHQHDHQHDHDHHHHTGDTCETCGHAHMPSPEAVQKDWSLGRMLTLAFAIGIRPCTGAILVLVFAISQGLLWAGVFATFAMAVGTAITVSALAALAVGSRTFAEHYASNSGASWISGLQSAVSIGAAAFVMITGATFFVYSLGASATF